MPDKRNIINLSDLDFDGIKQSLIRYLQQQDQFTDYNFEGSSLGQIINLLSSYGTSIAFLANMLANESFIDTAVKRNSVVSHAKHVGYTPRSITAATAIIDFSIETEGDVDSISLPKTTQFKSTLDNTVYLFSLDQAYSMTKNGSSFSVSNLTLKQGTWNSYSFVVDTTNTNQRFILPNNQIDTTTLTINVQNSVYDTEKQNYTLANNLTDNDFDGDSKIFFLQETESGNFEILFGDGILGKRPENGNIVQCEYITTSGESANGISTFTLNSTIAGDSTGSITTISNSSGGSARETTESIRFLAPKVWGTQNRAVTTSDYEALILSNFGTVESVKVWGGENGDPRIEGSPAIYGKVFIVLKPKIGFSITDALQQEIREQILENKGLVTITPEFVDAEYLFLEITTDVTYNLNTITISEQSLKNQVKQSIRNYNSDELNQFNKKFRRSKFAFQVDNTNTSILGSNTTLLMKKRFTPTVGIAARYVVSFGNAITHPTEDYPPIISSSSFVYYDPASGQNETCYIDDNNGTIRIYKIQNGSKVDVVSEAGTVDYETGDIVLSDFNPVSYENSFLDITTTPRNNDITPARNALLFINESDITVTATAEDVSN